MTVTNHPDVDAILRRGILNQWYLVCRSEDVGRKPLGIVRLGQRIALWRDNAGQVQAVEDFCPHRGAALSKGVVVDEGLACKYHGLVIDGSARIVAVPPVERCPLVTQVRTRSYATRESNGAVFLYFSDGVRNGAC
jgi:phenylpropionate dioxygenase-like ring-hydroxylating dioxygenase large terminal subunit